MLFRMPLFSRPFRCLNLISPAFLWARAFEFRYLHFPVRDEAQFPFLAQLMSWVSTYTKLSVVPLQSSADLTGKLTHTRHKGNENGKAAHNTNKKSQRQLEEGRLAPVPNLILVLILILFLNLKLQLEVFFPALLLGCLFVQIVIKLEISFLFLFEKKRKT